MEDSVADSRQEAWHRGSCWEFAFGSTNRKQRGLTVSGLGFWYSKALITHLFQKDMSFNPFQIVSPTADQVFKHMILWPPFSFKSPHRIRSYHLIGLYCAIWGKGYDKEMQRIFCLCRCASSWTFRCSLCIIKWLLGSQKKAISLCSVVMSVSLWRKWGDMFSPPFLWTLISVYHIQAFPTGWLFPSQHTHEEWFSSLSFQSLSSATCSTYVWEQYKEIQ